jgi:phosphotransferase system HPr-like phosphotransfer protein
MSKLRRYQVKVSVHFNFGQSEKNTKDLKKVRSKSLLALATLGFAKGYKLTVDYLLCLQV